MTVFFSQLINGLSLGSIYALIALGYSMVYGIILLLNFAHGDVIMVGAYMSWFVMNQLGLGPVTAVCATIITCTLLGVVIEKIAYTPLRSAPRISLLITAIGVSFFLEYTAELILGSGAKVIPAYYTNQTFRLGKVPLGLTSIITLVVTVLSMLVLTFLVQKTKLGKAMRAVSEDMDAARLMGINVNSTISFTFAVGSALAGIGSVLYCCSYPQATPTRTRPSRRRSTSFSWITRTSPPCWAASAPSRVLWSAASPSACASALFPPSAFPLGRTLLRLQF